MKWLLLVLFVLSAFMATAEQTVLIVGEDEEHIECAWIISFLESEEGELMLLLGYLANVKNYGLMPTVYIEQEPLEAHYDYLGFDKEPIEVVIPKGAELPLEVLPQEQVFLRLFPPNGISLDKPIYILIQEGGSTVYMTIDNPRTEANTQKPQRWFLHGKRIN